MARIGATIHMGAGTRRLTMQGSTWDLISMTRGQLSTLGSLLSDALGLSKEPRRNHRKPRKETHHSA